jgi:hypothetical protein
MYPRSSDLTSDPVFTKMRYFSFFQKMLLLQMSNWTAMGLAFVKQFTMKGHFICIDEANSSNMFLLNSLHLLI